MNYLLGLINRLVGDEQLTRMLFAAVIGLSVVMVVVALAVLVKGLQSPVQRRLMLIKRGHGVDQARPHGAFRRELAVEAAGGSLDPRHDGAERC